ncbi:hypothetical protein BDV30DRAFT_221698 [Aspergillus minisclerotigenes]|uniref:Uncharacterized protein n=1 Tax=Aspergillus minisclerotigenes TaxID=656917 RepID=A0A5N6IJD3_9EURO|nr:hypothetical protein BDV30DRAFT_221698 [Aspergillus minisclerotigenes]
MRGEVHLLPLRLWTTGGAPSAVRIAYRCLVVGLEHRKMSFQNRASGKVVVIKKALPFSVHNRCAASSLEKSTGPPGGHVYSVWHAHHLSCLLASGQWSPWTGRKQRCQASSAYDWHKPL